MTSKKLSIFSNLTQNLELDPLVTPSMAKEFMGS